MRQVNSMPEWRKVWLRACNNNRGYDIRATADYYEICPVLAGRWKRIEYAQLEQLANREITAAELYAQIDPATQPATKPMEDDGA